MESCGYLCPQCGHCCSDIRKWAPVHGVLYELECHKCGHVWWVEE